ncbi:glycosyltransferase 87 family protein [Gordonia hydrophobica]|uniref:Glycosyltransferase 87 family protein n=1 Tax=Gordonia hydrophobica TaxID=40516 RepID=A0ABZ2TYD9_9ACTN|nr:glycosyltransferase 87 family protein [Gordonia hydrophobica]MBM7367092.1 alpha-1,2-mannosyltransferase [Gordonia hydrophobica]
MSSAPGQAPPRLHRRLSAWRPGIAAKTTVLIVFTASAVLQIFGVPFTSSFGTRTRFDMDVYRIGGQIWHQGLSLYADGSLPFTSDGIWLPFTYPPFAALLFTPLGALSLPVTSIGISFVTAVLLIYVTKLSLALLNIGARENRWWLAIALSVVTIWFNPFWMTLGFGQINVVLMAAIMTDVFVLHRRASVDGPSAARWGQGVLIGLASAVKLTPLVFLGVFFVAGRFRAVITGLTTFAGAAAIGWIWMPADSRTYWTDTLFHTARIGQPEGRINQNLNAAWLRVFGDGQTASAWWIGSSLAVTVLALLAARAWRPVDAFAPGPMTGRVSALGVTCIVAVWGLLISPTTWAHHWVWCIPALLLCVTLGHRAVVGSARTAYYALAATGAVIFAIGPFQLLPPIEDGWAFWQHLVGNAFSLWGIAFLVTLWLLPDRPGAADEPVGE